MTTGRRHDLSPRLKISEGCHVQSLFFRFNLPELLVMLQGITSNFSKLTHLKTPPTGLYEKAVIAHNPLQSGKLSDPVELRVVLKYPHLRSPHA
jgi:hypothetical protein